MSLSVSMVAHPTAEQSVRAPDEWIEAIRQVRKTFLDTVEDQYIIKRGDPRGYAKAMYGLYLDLCGKWNHVDGEGTFVSVKPPVTVDSVYGFYDACLLELFREKNVKVTILRL